MKITGEGWIIVDQNPVYICERRNVVGLPRYDDEVWNELPQMNLKRAATGDGPKLATVVTSFWTEQALYFRFVCEDERIVSTMSDRDDPIYEEDVVEVFLGETMEITDYKEFELSPTNVQFDATIVNHLNGRIEVNLEWDAPGWRTAVHIGPGQKQIMYVWELPFAIFKGGTPAKGARWLMNCYRIDRGRTKAEDEYSAWSPTGKNNFHISEKFGYILFQ